MEGLLGGGGKESNLRRLSNPQKKPTRNHTPEILHQRRTRRYNGPDEHPAAHVDARFDARDEHVGRDLHEDVADEETVFGTSMSLFFFLLFSW